jgi:hypothetical protein
MAIGPSGTPFDRHVMSVRSDRRAEAARRHVAALRAFHTGLVAETDRHMYVLAQMARHITVLRQLDQSPEKKLAVADASYRHLSRLERLKQACVETYRDARRSLQRVRALYRRIVKSAGERRRGQ